MKKLMSLNIRLKIGLFLNWLRWAIELKTIPIWEVCWVSHRELTEEEKEYGSLIAESLDLTEAIEK